MFLTLGHFQSDLRSAVSFISTSSDFCTLSPRCPPRSEVTAEQIEQEEPRPQSMKEDRRWGEERRVGLQTAPASPFADI